MEFINLLLNYILCLQFWSGKIIYIIYIIKLYILLSYIYYYIMLSYIIWIWRITLAPPSNQPYLHSELHACVKAIWMYCSVRCLHFSSLNVIGQVSPDSRVPWRWPSSPIVTSVGPEIGEESFPHFL